MKKITLPSVLTPITIITLTGCISISTERFDAFSEDPNSIAAKIIVERDDFRKLTTFTGPTCMECLRESTIPGWLRSQTYLFLTASKSDSVNLMFYAIVIHIIYWDDDWRFYDSAYDKDGEKLRVKEISRKVIGCSSINCTFRENLCLLISRKYLEDHKASGITFKLYGSGDEATFFVPPAYVQTFLSAVAQGFEGKQNDELEQKILDIYFRFYQ